MPTGSDGVTSPEESRDMIESTDSSSLSPLSTSSPFDQKTSSIGEDESDTRRIFIESAAARARVNLSRLYQNQHHPTLPVTAEQETQSVNLAEPPPNDSEHAVLDTSFEYPVPDTPVLPPSTKTEAQLNLQRRAQEYNTFASSQQFVETHTPPSDKEHFSRLSILHTHYLIKKASTMQCDECKCKGRGKETYKCSACTKQICQECMAGLLERECLAQTQAGDESSQPPVEGEKDDYKWNWQGQHRHEGLKLCYQARKAAKCGGDFQIDIPISSLYASQPSNEVVTVYMLHDTSTQGEPGGNKRRRQETDTDKSSDDSPHPARPLKKRARTESVSGPALAGHQTNDSVLPHNVHGNSRTLQQLNRVQMAAADSNNDPPARLARPRPAQLDLRIIQPSPGLPQVNQGPAERPPQGSRYDAPRYLPPQAEVPAARLLEQNMRLAPSSRSHQQNQQVRAAPVAQNARVPQRGQQIRPAPVGPFGHFAQPAYDPPSPYPGRIVQPSSAVQAPLRLPDQPYSDVGILPVHNPRLLQAPMWAPPADTLMQLQLGNQVMRLTWEQYQEYMRSRHEPPPVDACVSPERHHRASLHAPSRGIDVRPAHRAARSATTAGLRSRRIICVPFANSYVVNHQSGSARIDAVPNRGTVVYHETTNRAVEQWQLGTDRDSVQYDLHGGNSNLATVSNLSSAIIIDSDDDRQFSDDQQGSPKMRSRREPRGRSNLQDLSVRTGPRNLQNVTGNGHAPPTVQPHPRPAPASGNSASRILTYPAPTSLLQRRGRHVPDINNVLTTAARRPTPTQFNYSHAVNLTPPRRPPYSAHYTDNDTVPQIGTPSGPSSHPPLITRSRATTPSSSADTIILSPSSLHRAPTGYPVTDDPRSGTAPLQPATAPLPPYTPLYTNTGVTIPLTPSERRPPHSAPPHRVLPYQSAHHSPQRAETSILAIRSEAAIRARVGELLELIPEMREMGFRSRFIVDDEDMDTEIEVDDDDDHDIGNSSNHLGRNVRGSARPYADAGTGARPTSTTAAARIRREIRTRAPKSKSTAKSNHEAGDGRSRQKASTDKGKKKTKGKAESPMDTDSESESEYKFNNDDDDDDDDVRDKNDRRDGDYHDDSTPSSRSSRSSRVRTRPRPRQRRRQRRAPSTTTETKVKRESGAR